MKTFNQFLLENVRDEEDTQALKLTLARVGHKHHLDRLVDVNDVAVKQAVADRGYKEHLDRLVDTMDHGWMMGGETLAPNILRHGYDEHAVKLMSSGNFMIRNAVARFSNNPEHLKKIANNPWEDHAPNKMIAQRRLALISGHNS